MGNGKENSVDYLKENIEIYQEIEREVINRITDSKGA